MRPLVEPASELTDEELRRYARHLAVPEIGYDGQRRLKNARVLCVGAGGLGSPALLYLAAAGVGVIGVVDDDVVDLSNLQREIVHATSGLGQPKTASAAHRIADINPLVTVVEHHERFTAENAAALLAGYDLVLDGTDSFDARYVVSDACEAASKPHVWGSILRFDGQCSVFWHPHGPVYRDLYPIPPAPGSVPNCADAGVLGVLPGIVGTAMAAEAIKLVTGIGRTLLGRVMTYDGLDASWREIPLVASPDRARTHPSAGQDVPGAACAVPVPAASDTDTDREGRSASTLSAPALAALLRARDRGAADVDLIDVREPYEVRLATVPGARNLPLATFVSGEAFAEIDLDRRVVLYCKAGTRSAQALAMLDARGASAASHLDGGVLAWIDQVDPTQTPY